MSRIAIVFTPYVVRSELVSTLLNELTQVDSCSIILRRRVLLTRADVEAFYPKIITRDYFPLIVGCLTGGMAEVIIITTDMLHDVINRIKGMFRYNNGVVLTTGLRHRYQQDNHSFEFLLHTTDSDSETDEIGMRLFGEGYSIVSRS